MAKKKPNDPTIDLMRAIPEGMRMSGGKAFFLTDKPISAAEHKKMIESFKSLESGLEMSFKKTKDIWGTS